MIGIIMEEGDQSLEGLAGILSEHEMISLCELKGMSADQQTAQNACIFRTRSFDPPPYFDLGVLALVQLGGKSEGTKLFTTSVFANSTLAFVDVYRLPA